MSISQEMQSYSVIDNCFFSVNSYTKKKRIRCKQLTEVICILNKVMELAIFFLIFFFHFWGFCLFVCFFNLDTFRIYGSLIFGIE